MEAMRLTGARPNTGHRFRPGNPCGRRRVEGGIRRAARLWGAVAGYRDATGAPRIPEERAMIEAHIDRGHPA